MSAPADDGSDARRRAVERIAALVDEAGSRGLGAVLGPGLVRGPLAQALAELQALDPQLKRRVARAMTRSQGDPAALRALLEDAAAPAAPVDVASPAAPRAGGHGRTPTVVDARGRVPLRVVAVALACAALAAFWLAQ